MRAFHPSPATLKKGNQPPKKPSKQSHSSSSSSSESSSSSGGEKFDYDAHHDKLKSTLTDLTKKLSEDLAKLRGSSSALHGITPAKLEALPVVLEKGVDGGKDTTASLRDLAHVVPKGGRALNITVHDAANVKKIITAIQRAELNVNPVVETNTNEMGGGQVVSVPLPPPTADARAAAAEQVGKVGENCKGAVRLARQAAHKKLQSLGKSERPDDVRKAVERMDKLVKEVNTEVDGTVKRAKEAMLKA